MELTIKGKTFHTWSKKRVLYTICFFLFCVIDQRSKTASGLDGVIETFRDMTGILMAAIIMSHYKWEDFTAHKFLYASWTVIGAAAGVLFVMFGQPWAYFQNDRVMIALDVLIFGYVVIHTFISVLIEKKYPKLNKGMFGLWLVMMLLMIFSRSDYVWPLCYFIMFGCFYLTDFTEEEQEDLYQGIMNGVILAFFVFQGFCCVFRPYDQVRYVGIYNNCNLNGLFYLEVLVAVFCKILYVTKECRGKFWKIYYWLGAGVVYSFLFMTIGRTAWLVSFLLGLVYLAFLQKIKKKKCFIKNGFLLVLCLILTFPVTFGMTRYLPAAFHHPVWFWGEWSDEKVHSWDAWNSEKYVDLDELLETAVGRTTEITEGILGKSPLAMTAFAAETQEDMTAEENRQERALLKTDEEYQDPFLVRKTIYSQYFSRLNLRGHTQDDQGFQLTKNYWIGHAHNIYLQYATDFGVPAALCMIVLCVWSLIRLVHRFNKKGLPLNAAESILFMLVPLLFGMLEYSWGSSALTIVLLFLCWRQTLVYEK